MIEHIKSIAAPHPPPSEDPHPQFVPSPILDKLTISTEVALSPIEFSCTTLFVQTVAVNVYKLHIH